VFTSFSPRSLVSCFRRTIALFSFMCVFCVLCFKMGERIANVIATYQDCLLRMSFLPATSYGSATLGDVGVANKLLIAFLFIDPDVGMQFLKDVELIRSMMACTTCGCQMTVNHTIAFVDERRGAYTKTIESTWRHVKAFLNPYNRQGGLHFPSRPVRICCTVSESKRGPLQFISAYRCKHGLERSPPLRGVTGTSLPVRHIHYPCRHR
jgi:hypothetical protein